MSNFSYEVKEVIGQIGKETPAGWKTLLTKVSWSGREPKYDIRSWSPDMDKMSKGVSFTEEEFFELRNLINGVDSDEAPLTHEEMLAEMAQAELEE